MNEFIEKNKKLLKFYHIALRLSGWLHLILGLCGYGFLIILARNLPSENLVISAFKILSRASSLILFGLLGLGIAQLIRYLYDRNYKPGFILRHGSKFIYIHIVLTFAFLVIRKTYEVQYLANSDIQNSNAIYFSTLITSIVFLTARALILIGVAQFLKRAMPIIEEHKSLV